MRKLKLLFTGLAFLGGVFSANAQEDVTSTYLTNADFSETTPITGTYLYGYGKDGSPYGYQAVDGWTSVVTSGDNSNASYPNSGTAAAVFSYGSSTQLKGNATAAPATNPDGEASGNCFGFFGVWGCGGYYYQNVTLAAGKYTITVPMYSQSGTQANTTYTGFFPTSGTNRTVAVNPTVGGWANQSVTFTLTDDTEGQIRIGYQSTGSGSGANPMLFIDCVKIEFTAIVVKDVLETALTAATKANAVLSNSDLTAAIATAQAVYDNEDATQDEVNAAAATLNAATELAMSAAGDVTGIFLSNPGFESCTVTTTNAAATGSAAPLDISGNWTQVSSAAWSSSAVVAYGGSGQVNGVSAPDSDNAGNSGNAFGVSVGWDGLVTYQSDAVTLPAGVYTLEVYAFNANSGATQFSSKFGFVPTEGAPSLSTKTSFTYNSWETDQVSFTLNEAAEGKIQIGGKAVSGGSGSNAKVFLDNITITYRSFLDGAKAAWDDAWNALDALDETALPDAAEAAITDALGAAEPTTVEGYNSSTAVLQALIDSYDGIKSAYDKVLALIVLATAEKDNSTADDKTALATAINTATTDIETRTTADDLTSDYNTLETARQTYVTSGAQPTADHVFDLTFKIADAAVTGTGWSASGTASGQQYTDAPDNRYFDCGWNSSLNKSQVVESLPAGYYTMKAATRAATSDITAANIYVNQDRSELNSSTDNHHDGSTGGELGNGWSWTEVDFELRAAGNVTVGFYAQTTGQGWAGADDYHLYYKGIAVDDEKADALKATIVEGKMNSTVADNQASALSTFESAQTIENYDALETAIAAANASKEAYTEANAKLIAMKAVVDATNVYTEAALNEYYTTPKSKYDDNSLTDDEANALQDPAETTGVRAAITVDNFLLSAWNTEPDFTPEDSPYYINSWSTEGKTDGSNMTTPFFEYWVSNSSTAKLDERTLTATLSDVPAGNYHVDVLVRVLKNTGDDPTPYGITLDVNGGTPVDVCAGNQIGSTTYYYDTFRAFGTVADDGVLTINFNVAEDNNISWLAFKNVTYAEFAGATEEQKTALASAITIAEGKKLGFEKDEYAPYNNVDVLEKLVLAKAIDPETATALEVTTATSNLSGATWTKNDKDVDAIYNGMFTTVAEGQNYPDGWTRTNGWGQMRSEIKGDYATAYYNQPGSLQYGNQGVYTMPLAENTIYKLTFAYRSHENNSNNGMTVSVLNGEDGLAATTFAGNGSTSEWKVVSQRFKTGSAGNYVLTLANSGNTWITNVSLVKSAADEVEIDEDDDYTSEVSDYADVTLTRTFKAGKWNTFVVPFDIDNDELVDKFGDAVEVAEYSEVADGENSTVSFDKMDIPAITANTPVLLKTSTDNTSFVFTGKQIKTGEAKVAGNANFDFVGTYAATLTIDEGDYFISDNKLWKAEANKTTIKGTRAYIKAKNKDADARIIDFLIDGQEATGISTIATQKFDNATYDMQGRRVETLKKGVYVVNGKKVVVK